MTLPSGPGPRSAPIGDLFERGTVAALDDGQLLARFADRRDETAFAALVTRHGPMVWATTRAILRHEQDAEDAFQATFLTLARRSGSVRSGATLAAWLHRVAYRSAVNAGVAARRQRRQELAAALQPSPRSPDLDLLATVQAEVDRLPRDYRQAVVLCDLEGCSYAEAADQFGCTEAALRNRLSRARLRLKANFERQGITTPAFGGTPLIIPTTLIRSTTAFALGRGTASTAVLLLVRTAMKGIFMTRIKLFTALIISTALGSAGVAALARTQAIPPATPVPLAQTPAAPPDLGPLTIRGQVVDPNGHPVAQAEVRLNAPQQSEAKAAVSLPTTTSAPDGRFTLVIPATVEASRFDTHPGHLVATAPGFGFGLITWSADDREVKIHLVGDSAVQGRIRDESGQPVVGAQVALSYVVVPKLTAPDDPPVAALDRFLAAANRDRYNEVVYLTMPLTATTNGAGEFSFTGMGPERAAGLKVTGPTIATTEIRVLTRDGPPVTVALAAPSEGQAHLYQASGSAWTVQPTRIIAGAVRDAATDEPLAGWVVDGMCPSTGRLLAEAIARSGSNGQYRLVGLPPFQEYDLHFIPPAGQPYLEADFPMTPAGPGREPVTSDFRAHRAPVVRGQMTDASTGQPVAGRVEWLLLPGQPAPSQYPRFNPNYSIERPVGTDGRYEVAVPPGPCILAFRAEAADRYPVAQGSERLRGFNAASRSIRSRFGELHLDSWHRLEPLDTPAGTDSVTLDLQVVPASTVALTLLDPAGEPLEGTEVMGVGDLSRGQIVPQPKAVVDLAGFTSGGVRQVSVWHRGRKLAATMVVAVGNGPRQTLKLQPWGEVRGRIVRADGSPRANANIMAGPHFSKALRQIPFDILPGASAWGGLQTDADGRFAVEGLVPGMHYGASVTEGKQIDGDLFNNFTVEPGEVKDLGDVKVVRPN